jgi:hypothetical protein
MGKSPLWGRKDIDLRGKIYYNNRNAKTIISIPITFSDLWR